MCYSYFGTPAEAEDATQATFMKLVERPREFENEEHERAWLIVVASNLCKDALKSASYTRVEAIGERDFEDSAGAGFEAAEGNEVLEAVLGLPPIYKDVVYLYYYEGMKTAEIAERCDLPPSTVRNRLSDARRLLKRALGGE